MRAPDVAARAGITPRQLDHWTRRGWVHCWCGDEHNSGFPRHYTRREAQVIADAAALAAAGVTPATAVRLARDLHTHGTARLGPHTLTATTGDQA